MISTMNAVDEIARPVEEVHSRWNDLDDLP